MNDPGGEQRNEKTMKRTYLTVTCSFGKYDRSVFVMGLNSLTE